MNSHFSPVQALVVSISLFAAGGVFGGALHSYWTSRTAIRDELEPTPAISSAEWSALKASIARIETQLANAQLSAPSERAEVGTTPTTSIDSLAQTVRELQASTDQLRLVVDKAAHATPDTATLHDLTQAARETNWPAIDALVELEAREKGAAFRDVRFSTPNEILRRFGPPESTSFGDAAYLSWSYIRLIETADGPEQRGARFVFAQGVVLSLQLEP